MVKRTADTWDDKAIKELDALFDTIKPGGFIDKQVAQTIFEQGIRAGNIEPEGFLAAESITEEMFTTLLHPTYTVDTLPTLPNGTYPEGQIVYLTSNGHFYYNRADAWIDGSDHAALANLTTGDPHTQYLKEADFNAKGDLISASANDTPSTVTVGANDTILMADSAQTAGLKWVAPATPVTQVFGDAASAGTSDTYSRGDHKHGMPSAPTGYLPLTTVVGGVPELVWDADNSLIPTEIV